MVVFWINDRSKMANGLDFPFSMIVLVAFTNFGGCAGEVCTKPSVFMAIEIFTVAKIALI